MDDTSVVELLTIRSGSSLRRSTAFFFAEEIQDTVRSTSTAAASQAIRDGATAGFTTYRRQKPGIVFFPSDRDAVFVVSLGVFGSVPV